MAKPVNVQVIDRDSTTSPALTTSYAVGVDDPILNAGLGITGAQTLYLKAVRAAGAFTGVTVKGQISYDGADPTDAAAVNWTDVMITELSTGMLAIEHSLSPGGSATAWAAYGSEVFRNSVYSRFLVKATGGNAGAGDSCEAWVVAS